MKNNHNELPSISQESKNDGAIGTRSLKTEEIWFDHKEAASFLRLTPKALYNLCSQGKVKHYKIGRRNRFLKSDLLALSLAQPRGGAYGNKIY